MSQSWRDQALPFLLRTTWQFANAQLRLRLIAIYCMLLIGNIIVALQPITIANIINVAQQGGEDAPYKVMVWSGAYFLTVIGFWIFHGPARVIERRIAYHVYRAFTLNLYRKVTELPLRWHQDHHSGGTISRVNKAGKSLVLFAENQYLVVQIIVRFVGSIVVLVYYSWWVALATFIVSLLVMTAVRGFNKRLRESTREANEREHLINAGLYDYIGNIVTVLMLRMQGNTQMEINHRFERLRPVLWERFTLNEIKWGVMQILLLFAQAVIVGAYAVGSLRLHEAVNLGAIAAIFQALVSITNQFYSGALVFEGIMYQGIDVRGVEGILKDHAELVGQTSEKSVAVSGAWRRITIEHLNFTHDRGEDALHHLNNINLSINAGQKIALIGGSGSGKTTLLTLMRGLYTAPHVELSIDQGTSQSTLAPLAAFTTLVPQDSEIFENSVRYNLTLGIDLPEELVQNALHITTFDQVVPNLPNGIETDIRERGVNLSGGQKQRLALARGLIAAADSSLVLLDEPTSSVDLTTEAAIFDRLFEAFKDKAIMASLHRLYLLPRFDHIVLMAHGRIIEQGSFGDLLASGGAFADLWRTHLSHVETAEGTD